MDKRIKIINSLDYNTRFPKLNEDVVEKLDEELSEMYLLLYSTYSYIFRNYIIEKLELSKYDQQIKNSGLNFIPLEEQNMDIYQYLSKDNLDYIYIRNNIYIENLSKEEREKLFYISGQEIITITDEIKEFIENTYEKLIFEDVRKDKTITRINYGPESQTYFLPNNSLVLGINYDEYNTEGLTDEEWDINHEKQLDILYEISSKIIDNEQNKLKIPLACIKYNQFSIQKKNMIIEQKRTNK